MENVIKAAMAAIEAEKVQRPNALQNHLTAVNPHLAAAAEANLVSEREVMELINQMW